MEIAGLHWLIMAAKTLPLAAAINTLIPFQALGDTGASVRMFGAK